MALPDDPATLRRWRCFVLSRWFLEHDIRMALVQALCLGMPMKYEDFLCILREYAKVNNENITYGRRHDRQS